MTVERLEQMLASGKDGALLRFSLGSEYLKAGQTQAAAVQLAAAVAIDRDYSAAWKLLGKALAECGRADEAIAAFGTGIGVAERRGDKQAAREMQVFLRRLQRARGGVADQGL